MLNRGLVAHRGAMLSYPENSLSAIQAALEAGAPYVEFDLQMNADGDFIVIHDDNFLRTSGVDQSVLLADTPCCRRISVHYPDRFAGRFEPLRVSFLSEVMALLLSYPARIAFVEIKCQSLEYWGVEKVMESLVRELAPYVDQSVLITYSASSIRYAQQNSQLRTGWILEGFGETYRALAAQLQVDYLICDTELLAGQVPWPEFPRWMLYDVMDPLDARAFFDMGVELIETGDIEGLLEFFPPAGE